MSILRRIKEIQALSRELEQIMEVNKTSIQTYVNNGRKGGNSTKEKYKHDPDYYKKIGRMGGKKNGKIKEPMQEQEIKDIQA